MYLPARTAPSPWRDALAEACSPRTWIEALPVLVPLALLMLGAAR